MQNTKNYLAPPEKKCEWDFKRRGNYAESTVIPSINRLPQHPRHFIGNRAISPGAPNEISTWRALSWGTRRVATDFPLLIR